MQVDVVSSKYEFRPGAILQSLLLSRLQVTPIGMQAAWTGIPHSLRPRCWRLLLRYEPPSRTRARPTVKRKRQEYQDMVPAYYDIDNDLRSDDDIADLKQVLPHQSRNASRTLKHVAVLISQSPSGGLASCCQDSDQPCAHRLLISHTSIAPTCAGVRGCAQNGS